ncbi:hypothetical protein [Legionella jordanis]|uniref:Coiled coil domain-containing protein n=1 Tax=Legionella jordanis TaxID=456 RepID=A0A0W0V956_9GAMM|nr:hypothetical protein [Legionella jordanis]KTD16683.1 coiled coil domain-containing protein [Legionella jordanis]RMX03784.1 hypothetical protein EAW55_05340 [Legionella jordanis]RMX22155.1 hypothetical protein EAS68_01085 [Legionella jordanis]VEH11849.1 coiled coil domain protein [Legionella jordanis]
MGLFTKPFLKYFSTTKELDKSFGLDSRRKFFEQYLQSINLSNGLSGTDSFNTYQLSCFSELKDFTRYKDEKGNALLKGTYWQNLEANNNHANAANAAIKAAVDDPGLRTDLANAVNTFNADMDMINSELQKVPPGIDPRKLPNLLHAIKAEAKTAIEAYESQVTQKIEALRQDANFRNEFKSAMGWPLDATSDTKVDQAITELKDTWKKSQKNAFSQFEKTYNESIKDIQEAIQRERDRIAYIGAMRDRNDKEFRDAIDKLIQQKGAQGAATFSSNPNSGSADLKGIKVDDLPLLKTITGRNIRKGEDGSFHLELPWYHRVQYWFSHHQKIDYDIQSIAEAIRACGYDKITMEVSHNDPEEAEEYGRKMYEACINAGFDPKNITIKVNGEERKLEKTTKDGKDTPGLFTGYAGRLQKTHETAKKLKEEREKALKDPTVTDLAQYKGELQALRDAQAQQQQQQQQHMPAPNNP